MNENLMFKAIQLLGGEQLYQAVNLIYTALEEAYEQGRQDGVEDVQVNALNEDEHDGIGSAVGDAVDPVPFATMVLAVWVARDAKAIAERVLLAPLMVLLVRACEAAKRAIVSLAAGIRMTLDPRAPVTGWSVTEPVVAL